MPVTALSAACALMLAVAIGAAQLPAGAATGGTLDMPALQGPPEVLTAEKVVDRPALRTVRFEANHGQTDPAVAFVARASAAMVFFTPTEVVLSVPTPAAGPEEPSTTAASGAEIDAVRYTGAPDAPPHRAVARLRFQGANVTAPVPAGRQATARINYLLGSDSAGWITGVPTFNAIAYEDLYDGVDVVYDGPDGNLKSTYHVDPGVDPATIAWQYHGSEHTTIDTDGHLRVQLRTADGRLIQVTEAAPIAWQHIDGKRRPVAVAFDLSEDGTVRFSVDGYDRSEPLVIDPELDTSTYLGGTGADTAFGVAVDDAGSPYVTGMTASPDFPTTVPSAQPVNRGAFNVFVTKLTPDGTHVEYSTYIGGTAYESGLAGDAGYDIAVGPDGRAVVVGRSATKDFPMFYVPAGPHDPVSVHLPDQGSPYLGGITKGFAFMLDATGSRLLYSRTFGGPALATAEAVTVDDSGYAYVTGHSYYDFPTTPGAYQEEPGFRPDAVGYVVKLTPLGGFAYSTILGSHCTERVHPEVPTRCKSSENNFDFGSGIAVDADGHAYVTGTTTSPDFPTTDGAFQEDRVPHRPGEDPRYDTRAEAFVAKLTPAGDDLVFSTYLSGSGDDWSGDIAIDAGGHPYVTGATTSEDFPTTADVAYAAHAGGDRPEQRDVFVAKLSVDGSGLLYATYLGGSGDDGGHAMFGTDAIVVDTAGHAYVTGPTMSPDFPIVGSALQSELRGTQDAFVAVLDADASALIQASYLGGDADDVGYGIALDPSGGVWLAGGTSSDDFPTTAGAFQPDNPGDSAAFVARITGLGR